jgi:hypothetical protein
MVAEEYAVNEGAMAERAAEPALRETLRPVVIRGPFAGLRYPEHAAVGSSYWPKLLGAYECELGPAIEGLLASAPSHVVDIGAAEGYYAVGIARRLPGAHVIAYEGDAEGRRLMRLMAELNDVAARVRIEGWCDLGALKSLAGTLPVGRTLLICDAETAEYDLLDPTAIPELGSWNLLVELHRRRSVIDPRAWVTRTFQATHTIAFVESEPRLPSTYPELQAVSAEYRRGVLFERTDPFGWAVLRPRPSMDSSSC